MCARESAFLKGLLFFFTLTFLFASVSPAKSLYVGMHKNDTFPGYVAAYKIINDHLQYQTYSQSGDNEWTGMTLDPCSGIAFLTTEGGSSIDLLNAKTMIFEETLAEIYAGAGIVFDKSRQKLYVVFRGNPYLYVFSWYSSLKILLPDGENYTELPELGGGGAWGIDIDKQKGELYVTNATNTVHYFDTNTWEHKGSIPIVVGGTARQAVGIALDSKRRYMYTGFFTGTSVGHTYLVRTDINDPNNPVSTAKYIGAYVTGLAMDEDTGYLYVGTTYQDQKIRVFNTLTWPSDACYIEANDVNSPAGMCLGDNIEYKPPSFNFTKVDINSPNSVLPGNNITYRITYGPNGIDHDNVVITDFLPGEVNYINPSDLNYNASKRTYTWTIGHLNAGASNNSVYLPVQVNNGAPPNGVITNFCEIESDVAHSTATASTNVGSWQPNSNIIYVDCLSLCSPGTGISWRYAYRHLQDALDSAASGRGSQIWVARGIYRPTASDMTGLTFIVNKSIPIYGHFAGNETSLSQRNLNDPNNKTILSGLGVSSVNVVTVSNRDSNNFIDGFTISGADAAGIIINDANLYITNCRIAANYDGINSYDSNFTVFDCNISNNVNGINAADSHFTISNSIIQNNAFCGIKGDLQNTPNVWKTSVKNNIIRNNGDTGILFSFVKSPVDILNNLINGNSIGIYFYAPSGYDNNAVIQNNTIVNNTSWGIFTFDSLSRPIIRNCIFWGNSGEIGDFGNIAVTYSCIEGGFSGIGSHNINSDPCFVNANANDFHLQYASLCIDAGDPYADYGAETDIDGQCRVIYSKTAERVDIGADEYFTKADYNGDSIVNFNDFAILAAVWKSANSPSITLDDDNDVDINDLKLFCNNWLWHAPCSDAYQSYMSQSQMSLMDSTPSTSSGQASSPQIEQTGITEEPVTDVTIIVEEPADEQSLLLDENQPPQIWLVCDGNMNPSYGDEVTVYLHSEPMLFAMNVMAEVDGDANITTAMSEADCNDYGWDLGWNSDPWFDPAGHWVVMNGVSWNCVVTGTVSYFKFRYYGGHVTVYITEESVAFDSNCAPAAFSLAPLVFGYDPNQ